LRNFIEGALAHWGFRVMRISNVFGVDLLNMKGKLRMSVCGISRLRMIF
jgi:hypothetical protein